MKISRDPKQNTVRYSLVQQGDVFEVAGNAVPPVIWLRTSLGLVNLDTGATHNLDYINSSTIVRFYPNATLVLEP